MDNFSVIPGDRFWRQKDGHLPKYFILKLILQFIRQSPVQCFFVSLHSQLHPFHIKKWFPQMLAPLAACHEPAGVKNRQPSVLYIF